MSNIHFHAPTKLFNHLPSSSDPPRALLILNSPISSLNVLEKLWRPSTYRLCADGGANRLYQLFGTDEDRRAEYLPNRIHGDLDSLDANVRSYYERADVDVTRDLDQYSTDFGKGLGLIKEHVSGAKVVDVLILGSLGGRVDQGLGLLSEMMRQYETSGYSSPGDENHRPGVELRMWMVSECSVTFLLPPGENMIAFPVGCVGNASELFTPNVGILPSFGMARITTKGLEWDVKDWETRMGAMVSTSNHVVEEVVRVWTDVTIVFTVEINAVFLECEVERSGWTKTGP